MKKEKEIQNNLDREAFKEAIEEMKTNQISRNIPSMEELAQLSEMSLEEVQEITSKVMKDSSFDDVVLNDPKKVRIVRKYLRQRKEQIEISLFYVNNMFTEIEDSQKREEARDNKKAELLTEYTQIEVALFTTRKNGKYMKSKHYNFEPHIGLNRRQRRIASRSKL